jgi:hypothetical protein
MGLCQRLMLTYESPYCETFTSRTNLQINYETLTSHHVRISILRDVYIPNQSSTRLDWGEVL